MVAHLTTMKQGEIDIDGVRLTHAKFKILEHQQNQKKAQMPKL